MMASPKKEGFLTDEQREVFKIAAQNADVLSSSPKSPRFLHSDHSVKLAGGGKAGGGGNGVKHVRRSHSGKVVRVKKGELVCFLFLILLM